MRTRILNKMTNREVEDYLERNDLIFIPVGTIETHGGLPVDAETVLAEAICSRLAAQADGLILTGLNYFYAGATMSGRATIQISTAAGAEYLGKLAGSLLRQGFRRQVYVTFHGPSVLTVGPMIRDFYERTKVPLLYLDGSNLALRWKGGEPIMKTNDDHTNIFLGAYKMMGQLEYVPLNVPESNSQHYSDDHFTAMAGSTNFLKPLQARGVHSSSVGYYFGNPFEHGSTVWVKTPQEREERAQKGIELIDQVVERMDIVELVEILRQVDRFTKEEILSRYGGWMFDPVY